MGLTNLQLGAWNIQPPFGQLIGGNVYWVKKTTDTNYNHFVTDRLVTYTDGTTSIYNTIQAAVDVTVEDRGDVIFVCAGKWAEEVKVIDKNLLRIYGIGHGTGYSNVRLRPSDASTHYPFTSKLSTACNGAGFHVLSSAVEIAGFYLDGGGGYAGIYMGGGLNGGISGYTTENASGCYIHNNMIRGGSEGQIGLYMNGVRFGVVVQDNIFERWTGAAIEMDAGNASNEACVIQRNHVIADNGAYGVNIYGEGNSSLGCHIHANIFGDRVSHAFTMAILSNAGSTGISVVSGNWFGCTNKLQLLATDVHSGNFTGTLNATEVYVDED